MGFNPWGIAVDEATNTIYTANIADGEHPGTVSVINGAACNGHEITGCAQTPASDRAGFGAVGIAIDRGNHKVCVGNIEDISVSVIDGADCNRRHAPRCVQTPPNMLWAATRAGSRSIRPSHRIRPDGEGVAVIPLG